MKKEAKRPCTEILSWCIERKDDGMEFMENRADAGTLTTSSPGLMRRWAVMPRPRLGTWVGVTPLIVMPRLVAHWRKFSCEGKGGREESMVGFW